MLFTNTSGPNNWRHVFNKHIGFQIFVTRREKSTTTARPRRLKARVQQQQMANLPPPRVRGDLPFTQTGVDFGGPFSLKSHLARGTRSYKAWIALFTCLSTRAVHLELVTSLSAEAFLAAFHRFTARRNTPTKMYSDRGSNFTSAAKILHNLYRNHTLRTDLALKGVDWQFNPPGAPHWGGAWESGIKSAKYHLQRIVGNTTLNYEDYYYYYGGFPFSESRALMLARFLIGKIPF